MIKRARLAVSKFLFCLKRSNGIVTFLRLIWFTKRYAWKKSHINRTPETEDGPVTYHVRLRQHQQDIFLRSFSGDIDIFYEMFWHKVYELPGSITEKARMIVDLGSNIGLSALYFLDQCPKASVVCIEPEESNFTLLLKNLEPFIRKGKVMTLQAAVDASDGHGSLLMPGLKYNTRLLAARDHNHSVPTFSMESLFKKYELKRIDILKMDIEGTERSVFSADTSWLQKVDCIIIEFHSEEDRRICLEVLVSEGFSMFPILRGDSEGGFLFWGRR